MAKLRDSSSKYRRALVFLYIKLNIIMLFLPEDCKYFFGPDKGKFDICDVKIM
jgi:hypothetical protein